MDEILLNGKRYISTKRAAQQTGYTKDYIGQLCRSGELPARMVGRSWYVDADAARGHRKSTHHQQELPEAADRTPTAAATHARRLYSDAEAALPMRYTSDERPLMPALEKQRNLSDGHSVSAGAVRPSEYVADARIVQQQSDRAGVSPKAVPSTRETLTTQRVSSLLRRAALGVGVLVIIGVVLTVAAVVEERQVYRSNDDGSYSLQSDAILLRYAIPAMW